MLAEFRRRVVHAHIRRWQVLGPFPNPEEPGRGREDRAWRGHDIAYPPESEPIDLDKEYDGLKGKVRWQFLHSRSDTIDLAEFHFTEYGAAGLGYAVCWVHYPKAKRGEMHLGSDDGVKAWLNRKLIHTNKVHRECQAGDDVIELSLAAGWNELRLKVDNRFGRWRFCVELRDPETDKPLKGAKFATTPPL